MASHKVVGKIVYSYSQCGEVTAHKNGRRFSIVRTTTMSRHLIGLGFVLQSLCSVHTAHSHDKLRDEISEICTYVLITENAISWKTISFAWVYFALFRSFVRSVLHLPVVVVVDDDVCAHTIKCHLFDYTQKNRFDFTLVGRSLDLIFYCDIDRRNGSKLFVVSLRAEHFIRIEISWRVFHQRCCCCCCLKELVVGHRNRFRSRTWASVGDCVMCMCLWVRFLCTDTDWLLGSSWFTFYLRHAKTIHR